MADRLDFYIIKSLLVKEARLTASETKITFVHSPATITAAARRLFAELSNLSYCNS